jgi:hypothetical protein
LEVDGRQFLWCVREVQPEDWPGFTLIVMTADKRFLVHYYLGQADETRHLKVIGPEFAGDTMLPLDEFYQQMRAGALRLGTADGQWAFGLALLKESLAL